MPPVHLWASVPKESANVLLKLLNWLSPKRVSGNKGENWHALLSASVETPLKVNWLW